MTRYAWTKYLEVSTNIAVLMVAIALLAALISARFTGPEKLSFEPGIKQRQAMPRLASIDYGAASRTVLLSLSTKCGTVRTGLKTLELDYRESKRTDQFGNQFKYRAKIKDNRDAQMGRWAWDVFLKIDSQLQ